AAADDAPVSPIADPEAFARQAVRSAWLGERDTFDRVYAPYCVMHRSPFDHYSGRDAIAAYFAAMRNVLGTGAIAAAATLTAMPVWAQSTAIPNLSVLRDNGFSGAGTTRIGNWIASREGVTDRLPACSVTASFRNGKSMTLAGHEDGRWRVTLHYADWTERDWDASSVHYWVDRQDPTYAGGRRGNRSGTLTFAIADPDWVSTEFRSGQQFTVTIGTEPHRFPLTHTGRAVDWVRKCAASSWDTAEKRPSGPAIAGVATARAAAGASENRGRAGWLRFQTRASGVESPFRESAVARITPERFSEPDEGSSGLEFLLAVLDQAGLADAELSANNRSRAWGIRMSASWTSATMGGAVRHYPQLSDDLFHMEKRRIQNHAQRACPRGGRVGELPDLLGNLEGSVVQCSGPGAARTQMQVRINAPSGGSFVLIMAAPTREQQMSPALLQLADAARTIAATW
ncbi:MAG: hypothetical protein AAF638_04520, partial [Pseudomonadota bacterium]